MAEAVLNSPAIESSAARRIARRLGLVDRGKILLLSPSTHEVCEWSVWAALAKLWYFVAGDGCEVECCSEGRRAKMNGFLRKTINRRMQLCKKFWERCGCSRMRVVDDDGVEVKCSSRSFVDFGGGHGNHASLPNYSKRGPSDARLHMFSPHASCVLNLSSLVFGTTGND